jgi:hypothetical protein
MILNSPTISGSLTVTGNILTSGSITISGSIASSSYALNATLLNNTSSTTFATTGSNTFKDSQYISSSFVPTNFTDTASLYTDGGIRATRNSYFSSSIYVGGDLVVFGTQSVNYITSSQLNIADNIITVNTSTPAVRFGGIAVQDSGSLSSGLTGSLLWDSQNNHWVYTNPSGSSYSGGMLISGPRASSLGEEQGTTFNALMKGQGGDHITSSGIFESGSNVGIGNSNPSYSLDVIGTGRFTGNLILTGSYVDLQNTTYVRFSNTGGGTRWGYIQHNGTDIGFNNDISGGKFTFKGGTNYDAPTLGTATGTMGFLSTNGNYGMYIGVGDTGNTWLQSQRNDGNTTAYNLLLNPNGGNVLIATTTSAASVLKLQVGNGTADTRAYFNPSSQYALALSNSNSNAYYIGVASSGSTSSFILHNASAGTNPFVITYAGNVGIGTTSPSSILHISSAQTITTLTSTTTTNPVELQFGNTTNYLQVGIEGSTGGTRMRGTIAYNSYLGSYNNYGMTFHTNNENRMTITNGGDAEFQGTNSNAKFKFWRNYSNNQPGIAVYNTSGTEIFGYNGNTSGLSITGYVSTPTYYGTANSATFAANVTSTYSTWQIGGSRGGYGGIYDTYSGMAMMHDNGGSGGFYREGSAKWTIYWSSVNNSVGIGGSTTVNWAAAVTNGTMFYTSESYATFDMYARSFIPTSDRRIKENVEPLEDSLDKIKQLEGVSYNRIEDIEKKREIGFIAQDVQEVVPEIVNYHEDTDTYGVDYDKITALLTEALKEEDIKVEALNTKVAALEAKIEELETRIANL